MAVGRGKTRYSKRNGIVRLNLNGHHVNYVTNFTGLFLLLVLGLLPVELGEPQRTSKTLNERPLYSCENSTASSCVRNFNNTIDRLGDESLKEKGQATSL